MSEAGVEIREGRRFAFGRNWQKFLDIVDDDRIRLAERSLIEMLGQDALEGRRFLDVGSGSGLFSLVARRLGAEVVSFDYDPMSVACTEEMRRRRGESMDGWEVRQGSVLDRDFLASLGTFDVVYAWGVLHHTGALHEAMANTADLVQPGGLLYIAIYNYQPAKTELWTSIKRAYVRAGRGVRAALLGLAALYLYTRAAIAVSWHLARRRPFEPETRGMSLWRDAVDWVGGWPFEALRPEEVFDFYHDRGFQLERMLTRQSSGCNEFVFRRSPNA